jgi:hypothetical protein
MAFLELIAAEQEQGSTSQNAQQPMTLGAVFKLLL